MKFLIPLIAIYLLGYGFLYHHLESQLPLPVSISLPKPHIVDPTLKPLVDKYQLYGVDVYYNPNYPWREGQWGYYFNRQVYVRDSSTSLDIELNHEYVHYKQTKSPEINWRPFYDSYPRFRQRMDSFYKDYSDKEVEAVACSEVRNLPPVYETRCGTLLPERSLIPFRL